MSLFPVDLDKYKEWTIRQLYYLLFPYIKEDFMGKKDCEAIHAEGNMQAVVSGATGIVEHVIGGGSDILISLKESEYRRKAEEGEAAIETAQETGRFTGR
jgi:hypothetical protein